MSDTTVWITGASSGIGAALARAYAAKGASVILSGRDTEALARVADGLQCCATLPFDATDMAALPGIVAEAEAMSGRIDLLINNAGISQRGLAEDTGMDVYRRIMEVDFFAPVALTKLVLPAMLERGGGHIAAVSSVAGKVGSPQRTGYCAAKHAVMGFFDALRTEVEHRGVRVSTIVPGFVRTSIGARALTANGTEKGADVADDVDAGISADEAASQIFEGLQAGRREIEVGGAGMAEMALLGLKRGEPEQLFEVMGQMGQAVVAKLKAAAA
jgi:short-subunit dehydrogenase